MTQDQWTAVDNYLARLFAPPDPALDAALAATAEAGMPPINVSPTQGKLLYLLARAHRVRSILEIGTLAGYSTIWLARALEPGDRLITLEVDPTHAAVARANIERARVAATGEVRLGPAITSLPRLAEENAGPFDLVFIDADKPGLPGYVEQAIRLLKRAGLLIINDALDKDKVANPAGREATTVVLRQVGKSIRDDDRLASAMLPTGDGLLVAVKK